MLKLIVIYLYLSFPIMLFAQFRMGMDSIVTVNFPSEAKKIVHDGTKVLDCRSQFGSIVFMNLEGPKNEFGDPVMINSEFELDEAYSGIIKSIENQVSNFQKTEINIGPYRALRLKYNSSFKTDAVYLIFNSNFYCLSYTTLKDCREATDEMEKLMASFRINTFNHKYHQIQVSSKKTMKSDTQIFWEELTEIAMMILIPSILVIVFRNKIF